jgi:hypothetical protein
MAGCGTTFLRFFDALPPTSGHIEVAEQILPCDARLAEPLADKKTRKIVALAKSIG